MIVTEVYIPHDFFLLEVLREIRVANHPMPSAKFYNPKQLPRCLHLPDSSPDIFIRIFNG